MDPPTDEESRITVDSCRLGATVHVTVAVQAGEYLAVGTHAKQVYRHVADVLQAEGAAPVQERIFASLAATHDILRARGEVLGRVWDVETWPVSYIEGTPADGEGIAGLHLTATTAPRQPLRAEGRTVGTVVKQDGAKYVYLSDLRCPGPIDRAQAVRHMYGQAERYLAAAGCHFRDVVRTWVFLADILDWYGDFNRLRTEAFRRFGLVTDAGAGWLPASTGIEGHPPDNAPCSMDLVAVQGSNHEAIILRSPVQGEAFDYGSAFSRAVAVVEEAGETVYVSGTAAVGCEGQSVGVGDLRQQVAHTLDSVEALIAQRGLTLDDFSNATVFIKHGCDAETVREVCATRAPRLLRGIFVRADICRPELLFEIDGTAVKSAR
ncbi:MAG: Rid family hydrolase [Armatimonadetes bacterium]|nr:Rid family hydrolase [Armatimonadota bacterium]